MIVSINLMVQLREHMFLGAKRKNCVRHVSAVAAKHFLLGTYASFLLNFNQLNFSHFSR